MDHGSGMFLCGLILLGSEPHSAAPTRAAPSSEATALLDEALDLMQRHSMNRDKIAWEALRRRTHSRAAGAQKASETYDTITTALMELGDHHSFLRPATTAESPPEAPASGPPPPRWSLKASPGGTGIRLCPRPRFHGRPGPGASLR
jgi:hypothetical protein